MSTNLIVSSNSFNAISIQKFIVSIAISLGRVSICDMTLFWTLGVKLPNNRYGVFLYESGNIGLKSARTLS
jgi:hypothetical protein